MVVSVMVEGTTKKQLTKKLKQCIKLGYSVDINISQAKELSNHQILHILYATHATKPNKNN
jgi:hypothetical protein